MFWLKKTVKANLKMLSQFYLFVGPNFFLTIQFSVGLLNKQKMSNEFPKLPEILAKAEMMERITIDCGNNSGFFGVLASFEGFGTIHCHTGNDR